MNLGSYLIIICHFKTAGMWTVLTESNQSFQVLFQKGNKTNVWVVGSYFIIFHEKSWEVSSKICDVYSHNKIRKLFLAI